MFAISSPIRIDQSTDFVITPASDNFSTTIPANCSDGHLEVAVTLGSGTFTFAWVDQFGVNRGNTNRIDNLDAGTYTLDVTDQPRTSL